MSAVSTHFNVTPTPRFGCFGSCSGLPAPSSLVLSSRTPSQVPSSSSSMLRSVSSVLPSEPRHKVQHTELTARRVSGGGSLLQVAFPALFPVPQFTQCRPNLLPGAHETGQVAESLGLPKWPTEWGPYLIIELDCRRGSHSHDMICLLASLREIGSSPPPLNKNPDPRPCARIILHRWRYRLKAGILGSWLAWT